MARKNHLIVDSGCTQDNERWSLSACGLNEESEVEWDGTHNRELVSCMRCQAKMAKPRPAPEPFHKERPILFNAAMVRATLSGQKTVTRRLVKGNQIPSRSKSDSPEHQWIAVVQDHTRWGFAAFGATEQECADELAMYGGCPYGRKRDRLWVRETWYCDHFEVQKGPYMQPADMHDLDQSREDGELVYAADGLAPYEQEQPTWKPSIHMPRWACRILLEITDVRVERLQDISTEQIIAEGLSTVLREHDAEVDLRRQWRDLWESTGGDWDANPWVWVVEFKRVTP